MIRVTKEARGLLASIVDVTLIESESMLRAEVQKRIRQKKRKAASRKSQETLDKAIDKAFDDLSKGLVRLTHDDGEPQFIIEQFDGIHKADSKYKHGEKTVLVTSPAVSRILDGLIISEKDGRLVLCR